MVSQVKAQDQVSGSRQELGARLAQYVAQQPASKQAFHRWMKVVEAASLSLVVVAFVAAMYVSVNAAAVPGVWIPVTWFLFVLSPLPAAILLGVHTVVLGAFPPVALPGKGQRFITGREALGWGWGSLVLCLGYAALVGMLTYAVATMNMGMVEPLIRVITAVVGVGVTISILYSVYRQVTRRQ